MTRYVRPGIYRRRLRVQTGRGWARADLEDDPHRYGVDLRHDGAHIGAVTARALRTPWTACHEAPALLERLQGAPLSPDPQQVYRHCNGREQCTHLLDLVGLAQAHAARGIARCDYDAEVPCFDPGEPRDAILRRNDREVLRWTLQGDTIVAPARMAGLHLPSLMHWAKAELDDRDEFEALWVLRRAVFVAGNRLMDLDRMARASDTGHIAGSCHVFTPGVADRAWRMPGTTRDFTDPAEPMLQD
ncbi:MAG TPA: DUF2889 domain-containing protein [Albitalea sp.]|uniref:DUF2889 domain-containing protein n=1 Tax=Piscinibacter sp. TaxID=1903157 RepID=UPI002ED06B24